MISENKKPELLAPAGTIQAGLAAIDAGADAIYTGLPRFNARERGQNCTFEEIAQLTAYAHRKGCNIYVTLNTLIKESELPDVAVILEKLLSIRPDAVIVQDMGVLYLIRKHFPELTAHASTQMGIHNSAGVRMAERMGIKRVILQRQVTYEEIDLIRKNSNIELEVFIHGALCTGRSGSCLFSSWMGGHSGNRGRCKQPCRRRYFSKDGNGFFFSPKDLYSLEDIPKLTAMGISSLKIEGRLRRADYVQNVVEAYRLMIDTPAADYSKTLPEAKRILSRALGRKWTTPFRTQKDFKDTIQHRSMGTSGRLIGTVTDRDGSGFTARLNSTLYLHDTIRIQPKSGSEGPGITVTKMSINGLDCRKATAGETCRIACDKPVTTGSNIFKTGSQTDDLHKRIEKLPLTATALDLDISITESEIKITMPLLSQTWKADIETQPARKHALDAEAVINEFSRTRSTEISAGNIGTAIIPNIFVPSSRLKKLRRQFWDWHSEHITLKSIHDAYASRLANAAIDINLGSHGKPDQKNNKRVVVLTKYSQPSPIPNAILAHSIYNIAPNTQEAVLPEFCAEADLPKLAKQIQIAKAQGITRFRATSLYALEMLDSESEGRNSEVGARRPMTNDQRPETNRPMTNRPMTNRPMTNRPMTNRPMTNRPMTITASYPLPVCNSPALKILRQYGVTRAATWVELGETSTRELLAKMGNSGEVITYARLPLLTTRMEIPVLGDIRDARGAKFFVQKSRNLTLLLPEKVFAIKPDFICCSFIDLTHAKLGETAVSEFNFPRELV